MKKICGDMRALDNEDHYTEYQREQYKSCATYYNYNEYQNNVSSFYLKYFSWAGPIQEVGTSYGVEVNRT